MLWWNRRSRTQGSKSTMSFRGRQMRRGSRVRDLLSSTRRTSLVLMSLCRRPRKVATATAGAAVEKGTGTETGGIVTARPEGTVGVRVRRVIDAVRSHRVRVRVQVRGLGSGSGFVF